MGSSPVRVTKNKQLTEGGLLVFDNSRLPRDSKGAGVNGVPGARQSREAARPQAGNPVSRSGKVTDFARNLSLFIIFSVA